MRRAFCWCIQSYRTTLRHPSRKYSSNPSDGVAKIIDGRNRLSANWIPNVKGSNPDPKKDDAQTLLVKTGFLQQAYSGFFQLLPLGFRVQEKIERLVDKHMRNLGASKLSLSSISSESLWMQSGRLKGDKSELLRLHSRASEKYLLAPTHEEEITRLVKNVNESHHLPIRLYQISRKYRDERRPRLGLLRAREFVMKDLYTFDVDQARALQTYNEVYLAYQNLFKELNIPFIVVEADTGSMGGSLSHEFHFATPIGEDKVFSCTKCNYVANESRAESHRPRQEAQSAGFQARRVAFAVTEDRSCLIIVGYRPVFTDDRISRMATTKDLNMTHLKSVVSDVDPGVENPLMAWKESTTNSQNRAKSILQVCEKGIGSIVDESSVVQNSHKALIYSVIKPQEDAPALPMPDINPWLESIMNSIETDESLAKIEENEICPNCLEGKLQLRRVVELGHTFYLGTRYSGPLEFLARTSPLLKEKVPVEMGCHGIGVSRMIGAVAAILADERGLNWPPVIAPYEAVIIENDQTTRPQTAHIYDSLARSVDSAGRIDAVIDDRDASFIQKLKDADLIGYPVIVIIGKAMSENGLCEIQCRRLDYKIFAPPSELQKNVRELLDQLKYRPEAEWHLPQERGDLT